MSNAVKKIQTDETFSQKKMKFSLVEAQAKKQIRKLKEFGILMGAVLSWVSAWLLWKERPSAVIPLMIATFFLVPAYTAPRILMPIEKAWMWFGEKMSMIMTTLLLTLTFFLVVTPMALLVRILGKDLLDVKLDKQAKTYWKKTDPEGPHTRPYLPY